MRPYGVELKHLAVIDREDTKWTIVPFQIFKSINLIYSIIIRNNTIWVMLYLIQ